MKFSYNWLKDYLQGKTPSPQKLAELLTFHSFEIEGLEKKGSDWLIDIDVLPNRAHDCFSHLGIAREVSVLSNTELKIPKVECAKEGSGLIQELVEVKVIESKDCPRYTAKIMQGIKVGQSPKWIKDRLKVCGLKPINNIVDITNYVMLETGQPLHAFDLKKVGKQIIIRKAKQGERIKTLDDKSYKLNKDILVIADSKKPIAIAGIKGGEKTGINKKTKDIVIEAANFNQGLIRKASKKLKLRTDASARFENDIDPNLIDYAQERVCYLIKKIAGGKIIEGIVDFYPKKTKSQKIKLDLNYLNSLLGVNIPKAKTISILQSLDFQVAGAGVILEVKAPTRRLDIAIPEDLIEEIGRVYGYQNIPAVFPQVSLKPPKQNQRLVLENQLKQALKELGFIETYNYSFIGKKEKARFGLGKQLVEIENPISDFNKYLRPSLKPHLVKSIEDNLRFSQVVKMFEIGSVFQAKPFKEEKSLAVALGKDKLKQSDFYYLKGVVEGACAKLGVKVNFKAEQINQTLLFEIPLSQILTKSKLVKEYQKIVTYPPVLRDLALLTPKNTAYNQVEKVIKKTGSALLKKIELFEVYSGKGMPADKENFAFHLIYQSNQKTLSSKEVDKVHQKIVKALEKNSNWKVRK